MNILICGTRNEKKLQPTQIKHFPANAGNYLKRNIEMVNECDKVAAWWDMFSYGTAHTIATAVRLNKPVEVVMLK